MTRRYREPELARLRGRSRLYFAQARCAWGVVLEGMAHYDFLGSIRMPEEEDDKQWSTA